MTARAIRRDVVGTLSTRATREEEGLPPLLILLTIVTGLVDALAYLKLGHVFVGNMTGNVVFLGFAAGGASNLSVAGSLLALGCFLPGGVAASRLANRVGDSRPRQLRLATAAELALCAAAVAVAAVAGHRIGTASRYTLIALLSLALGIQNATARRLAVADLNTTVLTLTLTGIAADSRLGGGSGAKTVRRLLAVTAMFVGAVVGALLLLEVDPVAPLAVALGLLAIVATAAGRGSRRSAPARR